MLSEYGVNHSYTLYRLGLRNGSNGTYQLTGRNLSLFGNLPATAATLPYSKYVGWGKFAGNVSNGLTILAVANDTYQYSQGNLSGQRFSYHLGGLAVSTAIGARFGGVWGAAVGLGLGSVEMSYDIGKTQYRDMSWNASGFFRTFFNGWKR